jgi:hypothetical protein
MDNDLVTILANQIPLLAKAAVSLPVAALLCAALAFRPRRRGTPKRDLEVIHTQIILGVVVALLMLVIGESLARAFGIVGAAELIRYRSRIDDPKDAGVMLSTLGLGLASGVGLYLLAAFATLFLLHILWFVEAHKPKVLVPYRLKVSTAQPMKLQPKIEAVLSSVGAMAGNMRYDVLIIGEARRASRSLMASQKQVSAWGLRSESTS